MPAPDAHPSYPVVQSRVTRSSASADVLLLRYFSTGSLTLSLQYRPVATLTMCTAGKMLPFSGCDFGEPPVDYERVASFLESVGLPPLYLIGLLLISVQIMTRLDEIVSPDLQVEVELLRAELVNDLGRDHMTPTRFHRVVLSVILQLRFAERTVALSLLMFT